MMSRFASIFIFLLVAACACSAQVTGSKVGGKTVIWSPPRVGWWDNMPRSTVPKEMIGKLRVADMPIVLEETNLKDAQKYFGGTIGSRGDGGESEAWLCLHGNDTDGSWILWLTSGEIDGPAISGFQWRSLSPNEKPDQRCHLLQQDKGGIELPIPLHPGMTETDVQKLLGRPTISRGKTLFFCHEHQKVIRKENYTVSNGVAIVFRDGVVWAIEVAKTTSN